MDILNVLEKATQINSVSGSENEIRKFISDNVKKYCDELSVDAMGNLIAHKKGSGKKIMFAAHMDEIGIIAVSYTHLVEVEEAIEVEADDAE